MLKLSLKSYTPTLCTRLNIPWQSGAPALSRGTDFLERKTVSAADHLFTAKDIAAMKATAALKAADRNPYSWNMELYEYPDGSGYEGRFTRRGIRLPPPFSLPQNRARGITGASRYAPTPMRKSQAKQIGLKPPSRKNRGRPSGLPVTTPNRAIPCFARPCPVTMWSPRGCTSAGLGCMKPH